MTILKYAYLIMFSLFASGSLLKIRNPYFFKVIDDEYKDGKYYDVIEALNSENEVKREIERNIYETSDSLPDEIYFDFDHNNQEARPKFVRDNDKDDFERAQYEGNPGNNGMEYRDADGYESHRETGDVEVDDEEEYGRKDGGHESDDNAKQDKCNRKEMFDYTRRDLYLLIKTLHRMITFWDKYSHQIIVDGLYGMRIAEGRLLNAFKRMKNSHPYYNDVQTLHTRLKVACEKIFIIISNRNETYAQSFLKVLDKPFTFERPPKKHNPNLINKLNPSKNSRNHLPNSLPEEESSQSMIL